MNKAKSSWQESIGKWKFFEYLGPKYKMRTLKRTSCSCIVKFIYSDLPNNCAANLINFLGKKHQHNLIRTYTIINFWDFFLQNLIFTYVNENKFNLHSLISRRWVARNLTVWRTHTRTSIIDPHALPHRTSIFDDRTRTRTRTFSKTLNR